MKKPPIQLTALTAVGLAAAAFAASAGNAAYSTCAGPAYAGCSTATNSWIETRSQKYNGDDPNFICTYLIDGASFRASGCIENQKFIRRCYYGGGSSHGVHTGSSNGWTVNGRVATPADANGC